MVNESERPLVYIIILNYNNFKDTGNCLDSLLDINYPNFRIAVIDNCSTDGSGEKIKSRYSEDPSVEYYSLDRNLGFAGGVNFGIDIADRRGGDYVLLLNNDVIVDENFLVPLVETHENENNVAAVSGVIHYNNGDILPHSNQVKFSRGEFSIYRVTRGFTNIPRQKVYETDYVPGSLMLISIEYTTHNHKFNEEYFFGFEDIDFCWTAKKEYNKRLLINSSSRIYHNPSSTAGSFTPFRMYHRTRNRLHFAKTKLPPLQKILFYIYILLVTLIRVGQFLPSPNGRIKSIMEAFVDHLSKKPINNKPPEYFQPQ